MHMCEHTRTYVCVCVRGGGYMHTQVSTEDRRVHGFLRARVAGVCELPNVDAGI